MRRYDGRREWERLKLVKKTDQAFQQSALAGLSGVSTIHNFIELMTLSTYNTFFQIWNYFIVRKLIGSCVVCMCNPTFHRDKDRFICSSCDFTLHFLIFSHHTARHAFSKNYVFGESVPTFLNRNIFLSTRKPSYNGLLVHQSLPVKKEDLWCTATFVLSDEESPKMRGRTSLCMHL